MTKSKVILCICYIVGLWLFIFLFREQCNDWILANVSSKKYILDSVLYGKEKKQLALLLAYSAASFFLTANALSIIKRETKLFWCINFILDFMILPATVLVMAFYFNLEALSIQRNASELDNPLVIILLMIVKNGGQSLFLRYSPNQNSKLLQ